MTEQLTSTGEQAPVDDLVRHAMQPAPTAIIIIDLPAAMVVQANPVAQSLSSELVYPCSVAQWSEAVKLTTLQGELIPASQTPAARVAAGQTVSGEPVAVHQRDGGPDLHLLWAQGWPITTESGRSSTAGIVVLADVSPLTDASVHLSLRDRAVLATELSFSISDYRLDDNPLVYVNPAFERVTGYRLKDVVGRNCRFMQGPGTSADEVLRLRDAIAAGRSETVVLLNYRADGTAFWNEVSVSPVADATGAVTHFVGVQTDVTPRVAAVFEREAALASETEAHALLEGVLSAAPVGLAFTDRHLRFTRVNEAMAAIDGLAVHGHLGRTPVEVLGDLGMKMSGHLGTVLATGEPLLGVEIAAHTTAAAGNPRYWSASYYPVRDAAGAITSVGAVVTDVTDRREAEQQHVTLLERERDARRSAERAGERLALLADSMKVLADSLQLEESLDRFVELLVPRLADWCAVDLADDDGRLRRLATSTAQPELQSPSAEPAGEDTSEPARESTAAQVFRHGQALVLPEVTDRVVIHAAAHDRQRAAAQGVGFRSEMVLPLRARGRTIGVLSLARTGESPPYGDGDLSLALDLATRAALAVDNRRLYEQERRVAETLQRALLPTALPEIAGLEVCVRYQAAADDLEVGGDWYDVVPLASGRVALSIGDVVGHDLPAAVRMGELRTVLRADISEEQAPGVAVDRLDRFAQGYGLGIVATLVHGVLDPTSGSFSYVRAGHLPPMVVGADQHVEVLQHDGAPPLGLGVDHAEHRVILPPGAMLVLYTDGLVEQRGESVDVGIERLRSSLTEPAPSLDAMADRILERLAPAMSTGDDVALLLARRPPSASLPTA